MIDLKRFELKGGKLANLRQSLSRGARDGADLFQLSIRRMSRPFMTS